jgi:hypothetical protein
MACLPGMPCFGPLVRVVYPPTCDPYANRIVSSDFVEYNGDNLSCTGIQNCDTLTVALQKIDNKICSDDFVAQIIQTIANDPVLKAYFCQLVSSCSPTTTTTSTTVTPTTTTTTSSTSTTTTTSSTSTTTTTTTIAPTTTTTTSTSSTTTTTTTISPLCNDFILDFDYNFTDGNDTLTLTFDGFTTIPAGFYQDAFCDCCDQYTSVTITDNVGHTLGTLPPNIPNLVASNTPFVISNINDSLNPYTDVYTVEVLNCITNGEVSCTKITSADIPNTITRCPELTVTPNGTAIDFGFTPTPTIGATYYVILRTGSGSIITSQTFTNPSSPVSSSFPGLTVGQNYKVSLELFTTLFGYDICETVNITPL